MVIRRPFRTSLIAAGLAVLGVLLVVPVGAAQAQADDTVLTVRSIDATDRERVGITFLWTGDAEQLGNLTIREDGAEQRDVELTALQKTEQRLATVYLVDLSSSMGEDGQLSAVKQAISDRAAALPDGDQMAVVSFTDAAVVESTFTSDESQVESALGEMVAPGDGATALHDGIRKAVTLFADRPDLQPNLVVLTDGANDAGRASLEQARASVVGSGAAMFAVDLQHDDATDTATLNSIIDRTGGSLVAAADAEAISGAVDAVDVTMRSQYVATYASSATQGAVDLGIAVGSIEEQGSYVVGNQVAGASTAQVTTSASTFGPDWLRSPAGAALGFGLVGLAVGLGVYALVSLATKSDTSLSAVLRPYDEEQSGEAHVDDGALAQTALLQRAVAITEDFAERQGFLEKIEGLLERADLPLRAAEALFFYAAAVLLGGLMALFGLGFIPGLMITLLLALVPPAAVNFMASMRSRKFVAQLPDTLNLLSGSLRAGYSFMQGIEAVSQEVAEPMGKELRRVITEARLGREVEDAMDAVAERMASPDFAWAVMAVRIQREVGGNLSELLLTVADTMVHRDRLRRDVSALTAEGKISAIILGLLPIGLGGFMWMSNPTYMAPLSETGLGQAMLAGAIVSAGIGFLWMKKTISIEI